MLTVWAIHESGGGPGGLRPVVNENLYEVEAHRFIIYQCWMDAVIPRNSVSSAVTVGSNGHLEVYVALCP